jgi:lipopolysaccharide/colanic/teichoic acid biosynthesis glycosyltransferase
MPGLKASVIVPAKDAAATINSCLSALLNQEGFQFEKDYEVILVDDGSADNTSEIAERFGVIVLRQENCGPAAARNNGVKKAQGNIILFTDSDCVPSVNWLKNMLDPFVDPEVMGVKGAYFCVEKNTIARFVQMEFEYKYQLMNTRERIDFIDTYSAAYRKNLFLENKGFEEAFPVPSVEDQELSFRLARKGYKLVFNPEARVFHKHDISILEYIQRKAGIGYWKAFMLQWLPEKTLTDTYTPASQRWQILILAGMMSSFFFGLMWNWLWWITIGCVLLFIFSSINQISLIYRKDRNIVVAALPLIFLRACALSFGLTSGFLFPPKVKKPSYIGLNVIERVTKRLIDIIGSLIFLVLGLPIMLIAILAVRIDSAGKVIYTQERIGAHAKPFRIYKLRTMINDAESRLEDVAKLNGIIYDIHVIKYPNDPRVTKVGRFLRRWSLDEIPQFWNILRGDMSLVGPRPEESRIAALYNDFHRQRLAVKPGLTGPMQISGRADLDMESRLELELKYIQNYSIWNDFKILIKTVGVVISGKGAY